MRTVRGVTEGLLALFLGGLVTYGLRHYIVFAYLAGIVVCLAVIWIASRLERRAKQRRTASDSLVVKEIAKLLQEGSRELDDFEDCMVHYTRMKRDNDPHARDSWTFVENSQDRAVAWMMGSAVDVRSLLGRDQMSLYSHCENAQIHRVMPEEIASSAYEQKNLWQNLAARTQWLASYAAERSTTD